MTRPASIFASAVILIQEDRQSRNQTGNQKLLFTSNTAHPSDSPSLFLLRGSF